MAYLKFTKEGKKVKKNPAQVLKKYKISLKLAQELRNLLREIIDRKVIVFLDWTLIVSLRRTSTEA